MSFSFFTIFFSLLLLLHLFFQFCYCATILVDGASEWKNPTVHIGDSIIFKHKQHYNLYIFKNQKAFDLCNFTQATLLTKSHATSYTWHPSRPGPFYFTFNDGSFKACQASLKLAIKVSPAMPPELSPTGAPSLAPAPGGSVSSSPAFPWPFRPRQADSPGPAPAASSTATFPLVPNKGGGSNMPFINSNPAVPLPTGEVDSATIRPLPTSGQERQVMMVIGLCGFEIAGSVLTLLLML
ncbi:early nodulin-like protein 3 [Prosopis cineraria]|uniref:early nodulin-like protein 3 n=1 Tax=Prosopis cineraria TaxID=364024 RepID=UPI00240F35A6|nr:early nodulin-like protein 3 [Prosopis cineraria]